MGIWARMRRRPHMNHDTEWSRQQNVIFDSCMQAARMTKLQCLSMTS